MKKIFGLLLMVGASLMLSSCFTDYDREVEKLISKREYDEARELVAGYIRNYTGEDNKAYWSYKIAEAQLDEIISDGDYNDALDVTKTYKCNQALQDVFADHLDEILRKGNYLFVFKVFEKWDIYHNFNKTIRTLLKNEEYKLEEPIKEDLNDYLSKSLRWSDFDTNGPYNADVRALNNLVDKVLEIAIEEKDSENIEQCLSSYKPYAALDSKKDTGEKCGDSGNYYLFTYKLVNTAKEEAQKKVAEAGIEL